MVTKCLIKPSEYHDSVTLMEIARELAQLPGVSDSAVVMATQVNKAILREAGLLLPEIEAATANDLVISVARQYAAAEAWEALRSGLYVLLFGDSVSLEDEIALKEYAVERGLLMMGPDCGTAIIDGVALGFANIVPRGPVGSVSAASLTCWPTGTRPAAFFPWRFVDGEYEALVSAAAAWPQTCFGDRFNPAHVENTNRLTKRF